MLTRLRRFLDDVPRVLARAMKRCCAGISEHMILINQSVRR
ncbi:MAG: hypothetical protein ACE5H8_08315 [Alphaproteobacteria bacterium]